VRLGLLRPEALARLLGKTMPPPGMNPPVRHTWDLDKLNKEELDILIKLSLKAQKPLIEAPENRDIVDLYSAEYEKKVAEVLRTLGKPRKRA